MIQSLKKRGHQLSRAAEQVRFLSDSINLQRPAFESMLAACGLHPLKPTGVEILQLNLGKVCNQTCKHCHVDAGPDRTEIMDKKTMQQCLTALEKGNMPVADLTGGAPELNPHFRWLVETLHGMGRKVLVRCNLTIIVSNPRFRDLPEFYSKHNVEVVSSLPSFLSTRTDAQRGTGVFARSIQALRMLNAAGYGVEGTGKVLNLVYNPTGAFLPAGQDTLEAEYKKQLRERHGIVFNNLFTITNLPISRFLEYLLHTDNYETYMDKLIGAFNPAAAAGVMCRNTLSVGWDGSLYDCDFNQMLEMGLHDGAPEHIRDFDPEKINNRRIVVNQHCYGCTAGAGSSCGGETAK
jgi:radical SAM/Cys-rich protein